MASGTPTIAFPRGSAPELIEPAVSGFLVDGVDAMVDAVTHVDDIDPRRCARVTRDRFSPAAMARRYGELYDSVLRRDAAERLATHAEAQQLVRPR
jgi:glycosyltransferase involved in cell wall biosynthesis